MGDTEAMREAQAKVEQALYEAEADGLLRSAGRIDIAKRIVAALASTEAPERPKRKVSYTSSDACLAPVGERVPEGVGVRIECYRMGDCQCPDPDLDSWSNCCRYIDCVATRLVPDTPHEGEPE